MSQATATPVSSYQSQIYEQPTINGCRWAWCRLFFPTHADLVHHVIHEHVRTAIPIMRKELPMIRRAEEGSGESLSLSIFGLSYPRPNDEPLTNNKTEQEAPANRDIRPETQPSSSLPSPPASSPASISPLPPVQDPDRVPSVPEFPDPDSDPDASESEISEIDQPSPTPARHAAAASPRHPTLFVRRASPVTPPPRQGHFEKATPSFAALSSPADSPLIPPVPPTPSFNSQVESATGKRKRDDDTPSKTPPQTKLPFRHSFGSHSSLCSQDSVEKHLTQSMEVYDGDYGPEQAESDMRHAQLPPVLGGSQGTHAADLQREEGFDAGVLQRKPSQTQMEALLKSTILPRPQQLKQAWYGTRPPTASAVKQKKSASSTGSLALSGTSLSQSSNLPRPKPPTSSQLRRPHPTSLNVYRSGILEITPPAAEAANSETQEELQDVSDSQSQSQTEENSLEYLSYPLQTQAPYQSQSLSQ